MSIVKMKWITPMSRVLLLVLLSSLISIVQAQNQSSKNTETNKTYYYGKAAAIDQQQAVDKALDSLIKEIAKIYEADFTQLNLEIKKNKTVIVEEILRTYTEALNTVVKKDIKLSDNEYIASCSLSKSEINKIFEKRKNLIIDLYEQGMENEIEGKYGYALKLYYFAALLINSTFYKEIHFGEFDLITLLPRKINSILSSLKFKPIQVRKTNPEEVELHLEIYKGEDICNQLEFTFWDGSNQISVMAKDGKSIFRVKDDAISNDQLKINIKYNYYDSRNEINEVAAVWNLVTKQKFSNDKLIDLKRAQDLDNSIAETIKTDSSSKNKIALNEQFKLNIKDKKDCNVIKEISEEAITLITLMDNHDIEKIGMHYSEDTFLVNKIIDIVRYNNISIAGELLEVELNNTFGDYWELRSIPVITKYSSIKKQSFETIILDFAPDGKLYDVNFAIMDNLYNKFVEQGNRIDDWGNRQIIVKFAEKYRTAFLSRDIKTLESIFADEAVIITGRIFKNKKGENRYSEVYAKLSDNQPDIEYLRHSKTEYLNWQKTLFDSYTDIYLGYSTFNMFKKNSQDSVYGISMRQNYNSTNYADEGYLFLLVDFTEDDPQIYVRSWQPQEWDESSLIKLSNFKINR